MPEVSSAFEILGLTISNSFVTREKLCNTNKLSLLQTKPNKELVKGKQASRDYPQLYRTDKDIKTDRGENGNLKRRDARRDVIALEVATEIRFPSEASVKGRETGCNTQTLFLFLACDWKPSRCIQSTHSRCLIQVRVSAVQHSGIR
jgi:hypothetical protein